MTIENSDHSVNTNFEKAVFWEAAWKKHLDIYLSSPPRCGYWIASKFPDCKTVLEIAGGSCRDSRYLATKGFSSLGTDFDEKTIKYLLSKPQPKNFQLKVEDGFNISFGDSSFDTTFSNGFWVCFNDNSKLEKLLLEQFRITKKYLVCLVHNAANNSLKNEFANKAEEDSLYNIRFFSKRELLDIVYNSKINYKSIKIYKFGGPIDIFLRTKRLSFIKPILIKLIPKIYQFIPLSKAERLAMVITLDE